jgi:hypothetical protein
MNRRIVKLWSQGILGLLVLLLVIVPVNAQSEGGQNPGQPGSLNYLEGQVSIDSQALNCPVGGLV